MDIEIITKKQFIAVITTFLLGSSLVLGVGGSAGKDAWIAVACAMLYAVPVYLIYGRIVSLFPEEGLFEIITIIFGKILGKMIIFLFAGYSFYIGTLVVRNFTEFINVVTLHDTPQYIIAFFMIILSIWAAKSGIEVIGRWSAVIFPIILSAIIFITLLFIPFVDLNNIRPILYKGLEPVLDSAFSVFTFPFAEVVLVLFLFGSLKKGGSPYKVFFWSLLIGGSSILIVVMRSFLVLGEANTSILYFASYTSIRIINIGEFLERIEVLAAVVFMLGGFVKVSICLLVACKGTAKVLSFPQYRQVVAPVGLVMMLFSIIIHPNIADMLVWTEKIYPYFALPFEVIFPVIIWIGAEIKARRAGSNKNPKGDRN